MGKLYAGARALALLLAIVTAFATVPYAAAALLVLGAIAALGNQAEDNTRVFLVATVLTLGARSLAAIPLAGPSLATIFSSIGVAAIGASAIGVLLGLYRRTLADWRAK